MSLAFIITACRSNELTKRTKGASLISSRTFGQYHLFPQHPFPALSPQRLLRYFVDHNNIR